MAALTTGGRVRFVAPDRSYASWAWPGDRLGTIVARPSSRIITRCGETPAETLAADAAYAEKTWIVLWDGAVYGHHHDASDLGPA